MAKRPRASDRLAIEVLREYPLEYGVVAVLKGRYKGRIGYYDNDGDNLRQAIVYLDGPPLGLDCVLIWKKWLHNATAAEDRRYRTQHMNELAYHRGIVKAFGPRGPRRA